MPADEARRGTDADTSRGRTGPRHAAPKKPLLTRLHVPAGKAIALAAMPTAVLMGMGLTPQLAQAKPGVPKNPFRDGPCVTAPDEQSKDAEKDAEDEQDAKEKAAKEAAAKAEAAREKADEARDKADGEDGGEDGGGSGTSKPSGGGADAGSSRPGSSGDADSGKGSGDSGADSGKDSGDSGKDDEDAADEPAPDKPKNPLDPLGLGDALKDILTPKEKKAQEEKAEEERAAEEESGDDKSSGPSDDDAKDSDGEDSRSGKATKPAEDTLGKAKDGLKDTADKAEDRLKDAADKADDLADKAEKAAEKAKEKAEGKGDDEGEEEGEEESKDPMAPDEDGKKPFPCVVEKKVAGDDEQSPAPIPNQPWHLEASSLLLKGADYKGVVNLKMPDGRTKQALKYIISGGTDIGDLHQIVESPNGKKYHVQAAKGSTSTIRGGDTTMYTERISGNLFGLIPVTFDPEHPPPLNLPLIYFTNVKVQQAGQFGGELTIPGLHQSITD
ncbi:hypothetical protein [Streptomyces flavofungini]|uniref:hypothetical protein n=1 Tax=Streptomyces flavofungini TaxID=68200 RepID=UPI0025B09D81|nr:hypothetical protein [Streptomyces flavofungini]WJV46113.1 hypothetical protein QUY26_11560 [Streptomyces flavofungini]